MIAPSSPFPRAEFDRGVALLSTRYRVSFADDLFSADGYLAGSDARRLAELERALTDPSVDAIVCARGGYGATRLLDAIAPSAVRAARKLLVGFSDVTALHALFARAGLCSLHGPMVTGLGRAGEDAFSRWAAVVEGAPVSALEGLRRIAPGQAEGVLLGGNLAVLAALIGTPYAPPIDGAILLLEDVGEAPYRVDRMLTTLRHAGWLERVRGIVLGSFTGCDPRADGRTVDAVLAERLADRGVPVVGGVSAGHQPSDEALPLGVRVRVDGDRGALSFLDSAIIRVE